MTMFDVNIGTIYRFLVMREAFEVGLITADTWKQILEQLMMPMIDAYKEGANRMETDREP